MCHNKLYPKATLISAKSDTENCGLWLPLHFHLLDTAGIMVRLINNWLSLAARRSIEDDLDDETLWRVALFLALTHDLGKATPAFQQKIVACIDGLRERLEQHGLDIPPLPNAKESPHPLAGEALLRREGVPKGIASIVGAHHGHPTNLLSDFDVYQLEVLRDNYEGKRTDSTWRKVQDAYLNWALNQAGFSSAAELPVLPVSAQMLLTGVLIMSDWIASDTRFFPLIAADGLIPPYDSARVDRAWSRLNLAPCWSPDGSISPDELCRKRFAFEPNALQAKVISTVADAASPGLLIIEAQMGSGKTEAALLAAELMSDGMNGQEKRGGIFFGLPTQATANGIFDRVADWGRHQAEHTPATIRLAHGAADLNETYSGLMQQYGHIACLNADADDDSGMMVHEWFRGRKQALLSDFVVGTVDQLLMMALKQRHVMLRHLGLCGKVVIIDECHAYDAYMSRYLEAALQWLGVYKVPVILLSATLPSERRCALIDAYLNRNRKKDDATWRTCRDYPLLTWTDGGNVHQQTLTLETSPLNVSIERLPDADDVLPMRLHEALDEGGCAGIIVNTVRRAQELARMLRDHFPDFTILLLHAQYILPDRAQKEKELLERVGKKSKKQQRDKLIVVGTQVCEQSLDLDFDLLVTELCPMDLLLQRLGRLHRHRNHDADRPRPLQKPLCLVLGAGDVPSPGSVAVYGEYLLMRTRALLPECIVLPGDIPGLVQDTYDDRAPLPQIPEGYDEAREKHLTEQKKRQRNANTFRLTPRKPTGIEELDTLDNLLEAGLSAEEHGEQAVRDGDPSIEVLVLRQNGDAIQTLAGGQFFYADHVPDENACREIAAQKLRLPHAFCTPWMSEAVIDALIEERNVVQEWLQSPWLRGQLFLLLDDDGRAELCGRNLRYDHDYGLMVEEVSHAPH